MSHSVGYGLVSVIVASWGNDVRVDMVAGNVHHSSCGPMRLDSSSKATNTVFWLLL